MKRNIKFLTFAVTLLSVFGLYSCDENATIDVPGPPIEFTLNYDDINSAAPAQRSFTIWTEVASETVPGENVTAFLEKDSTNKKYADAIVAATIKNGELTVTGGDFNFAGVDSVKITYKLTGSTATTDLVVGAPQAGNLTLVSFNNIKITKDEALLMMKSEKVVSLLVKINPMVQPNCFAPGAIYNFTAETLLSVKAMTALGGGLGL